MSRTVVMTVTEVRADLINVTTPADRGQRFVPGYTWVEATDGSEFHRWQLGDGERCFVGDEIEVVVIDQPRDDHTDLVPTTPPPLVRRFVLSAGDTLFDASADQTWRWTGRSWEAL